MSEAVRSVAVTRRGTRFRPRVRGVVAPVLVLAGVAGVAAVIALPELPGWLAWAPPWVVAAVGAAMSVAGTLWFQPWAARRRTEADRERVAVDQLRQHLGRQDRLPRLGDPAASAFALRVHPTIAVADGPARSDERNLPMFVERDVGPRVGECLRDAARAGGFLVLIGNSSVGKTRLLYEAARAELTDFSVLAPDLGNGELVNKLAEATFPLPKLIVWLDELQRFLDGPYLVPGSTAITAATIRKLLDAPTPVVVVGTLWPEHAVRLHATDTDAHTDDRTPRYPAAVDILDDRRLCEVAVDSFSDRERAAAALLADRDPRLAQALDDERHGVTEVLAGAAELVRRYERATATHKAVIHAAVDARRVGIQSPLTVDLLRSAARGYLTRSHADDRWFAAALDEWVTPHRGVAALPEIPDATNTDIQGYTVADYLLYVLSRQRRAIKLRGTTWDALVSNTSSPSDRSRLAESALARQELGHARVLFEGLAADGDKAAAHSLVRVLTEQGEADEAMAVLTESAARGDLQAAADLARLLADRGQEEELRARMAGGDPAATEQLVNLLDEQGRLTEATTLLADRIDAGDVNAPYFMAELLTRHDRMEEAIAVLAAQVNAVADRYPFGSRYSMRYVDFLYRHQRVRELREYADAQSLYDYPAERLAELLGEQGEQEDVSEEELRARVAARDFDSVFQLAALLHRQGRVAELRARADAGEWPSASHLAELLAELGEEAELRERADAGDSSSANALTYLLATQGRIDDLRTELAAGNPAAADRLRQLGYDPS